MYIYRITHIIPSSVADKYKEDLINNKVSEKDLKEFVKKSNLWDIEANYLLGTNKAFKLETENAFGDWIVLKFSYGAPFLWNTKTLNKQFINPFELYVLIQEFCVNKYNSLNIVYEDGKDIVIKEGKKFINGVFVENLKPLGKIVY